MGGGGASDLFSGADLLQVAITIDNEFHFSKLHFLQRRFPFGMLNELWGKLFNPIGKVQPIDKTGTERDIRGMTLET